MLSPIEQGIKEKIENIGIPLKEWDVKIYRGILTGYNEAFIIDEQTRNKLVDASPKSAEIIRPILRGRDIKKYISNWADLYLINTHTGYKSQNGNIVPPVNLDEYPAVKEHLDKYSTQLLARQDKGVTPYHLRSCIYMEDFFRPKIIYPEITKFINFYLDTTDHYYVNNKCFILTGVHIEYLTAFFNSKLFKFCFTENFPELMGGTRELRKVFFEKIPVMKVSDEVNEVFKLKISNFEGINSKQLEEELNTMIFELYNLTAEEIFLINKS
ncbi:TaqI-like C-terminal specificity domain-containing protein [Flavobacterium sp. LB2P84]|uniref:TaqI-like C-terminal specificity domain-containing protein n=1 Tax=Flavobacterium yafengii TaxID=3041253 RepID=UPI0024A9E7DA|nr:TaqI-like C-terminal specificity domain-containing protein [Flavobacterium yafengii]MDI6033346.1 TaqI-like C-terminal specificity domain-containing protein [Flavobacterium yafengii]